MDYLDPIPQGEPVAQLQAAVVPAPGSANAVVDLLDVLFVAIVAVASMFFSTLLAMGIFSYSHGLRSLDVKELSHDAFLIVPVQVVAYLMTVGFMAFLVWVRHQRSLAEAVRWKMPLPSQALAALAGGAVLGLGSELASGLLQKWIPKSLPIDQYFRNPQSAYLLAAFGIFVAPLVEELFFRGFIYPALARWTGVLPAIVVTAAGFSLLHLEQLAHAWAPLVILFGVGIVLTAIRARTQSVAICWLVHMGYNSALFTLFYIVTQGFRHMEKA